MLNRLEEVPLDHLEVVKTMSVRRLVMFGFLDLGAALLAVVLDALAFSNRRTVSLKLVRSGTARGTSRIKFLTSLLKMAVRVSIGRSAFLVPCPRCP